MSSTNLLLKHTRLVAKNDFYMDISNEQFLTKGRIYSIKEISNNSSMFTITDDASESHWFDMNDWDDYFDLFEMSINYSNIEIKWNNKINKWISHTDTNDESITATFNSLYYITRACFPFLISDYMKKKYLNLNDDYIGKKYLDLHMIDLWKKRLSIYNRIKSLLDKYKESNSYNDKNYYRVFDILDSFSNRVLDRGLTPSEVYILNQVSNQIKG